MKNEELKMRNEDMLLSLKYHKHNILQ